MFFYSVRARKKTALVLCSLSLAERMKICKRKLVFTSETVNFQNNKDSGSENERIKERMREKFRRSRNFRTKANKIVSLHSQEMFFGEELSREM